MFKQLKKLREDSEITIEELAELAAIPSVKEQFIADFKRYENGQIPQGSVVARSYQAALIFRATELQNEKQALKIAKAITRKKLGKSVKMTPRRKDFPGGRA